MLQSSEIDYTQADAFHESSKEIERVMRLFADGSGLYCTSHFVQDHCSIEELVFALDTMHDLSRAVRR